MEIKKSSSIRKLGAVPSSSVVAQSREINASIQKPATNTPVNTQTLPSNHTRPIPVETIELPARPPGLTIEFPSASGIQLIGTSAPAASARPTGTIAPGSAGSRDRDNTVQIGSGGTRPPLLTPLQPLNNILTNSRISGLSIRDLKFHFPVRESLLANRPVLIRDMIYRGNSFTRGLSNQ